MHELKDLPGAENLIPPIFSAEGFKKLAIPKDLFIEIMAFYESQKPHRVIEQSDAIGTYIKSDSGQCPSLMVELSDTMRNRILWFLIPLLGEWVNLPLRATYVYGIREYKKGATLKMHVDRTETHQVSAILNIAQDVNAAWPLQIYDHMGRLQQVFMEPGEMLFYESARLPHGRTVPLDGDCFANIFIHTCPA
jgi:prolyl 4-hydroxylase